VQGIDGNFWHDMRRHGGAGTVFGNLPATASTDDHRFRTKCHYDVADQCRGFSLEFATNLVSPVVWNTILQGRW
jgi:hypothetical protein